MVRLQQAAIQAPYRAYCKVGPPQRLQDQKKKYISWNGECSPMPGRWFINLVLTVVPLELASCVLLSYGCKESRV